MPARNVRKVYIQGGYYHIYNRGVEKRDIFMDNQDFSVFLNYLKEYLSPKNQEFLMQQLSQTNLDEYERNEILKKLSLKNFTENLDLLAYSLLPNHLHLLVHQKEENTIDSFMNALGTRYVLYFNHRNKRVGPLFQGTYKAVLVESEEQLLHLSRYIHFQAQPQLCKGVAFRKRVPWPSSYPNYLGKITESSQPWVKSKLILDYFKSAQKTSPGDTLSYQSFVEDGFSSDTLPANLLLEEPEEE